MSQIKACIFDLDGVIVDTAKYHYVAWRKMCLDLGFDITEAQNELLKGVSRTTSLEILLKIGNVNLTDSEKNEQAEKKNNYYLKYIEAMDESEILPGIVDFLKHLKQQNVLIALGSASKNAGLILEKVQLTHFFDAIIDGNAITHAKPNPEVFLKAAAALHQNPTDCLVFEDAQAGVEAALNAAMKVVGIGTPELLGRAHLVTPNLVGYDLAGIEKAIF